ncbi:NERD domain-containing protein [Bacteroides sp. 519]|uniref:NERD domain-containing protein n=1 Tax=Bacteroides sp. 519 TaxID=2302937 RepID=UPI0013D1340E|nr:NERD domain-containing protein [Bacteroides sp. 519]NDV57711.1 NERD domain-containing protein [Bacteroides sp. 519]
MNTFTEGSLIFEHNEHNCDCIKFDENIAHIKVKDVISTKGVDFIYLHEKNKIIFIEVKNFRGHTSDPKTKERLKSNAEELMTEIAIKVRDSMACGMSAARFSTNDEDFWKLFGEIFLKVKTPIRIIAWIEFDESNPKEKKTKMAAWNNKLKQKLSWLHPVRISVNNIDNPPMIDGIRVRFR